jgi:hypothetical protein
MEAILTVVATKAKVVKPTSEVAFIRAKDGFTNAEVGLIELRVGRAITKSVSTRPRGMDAEAEEISTIPRAMATDIRVVIGKGKVVKEKA